MRYDTYLGDCLEVMQGIPDGSVDMILSDLPYGVLNRSNQGARWDERIPMGPLWKEYGRIAKPTAAIILFGQGMFTAELMLSNPKMWRYNLIWQKTDRPSGFLNARRMPLRSHEDVLVFYQKLPKYNPQMVKCEPHQRNHSRGKNETEVNNCYGNYRRAEEIITDYKYPKSVLAFPRDSAYHHPTQKPVGLCEWLIRTYTDMGETVLDSCMGSGTTGVACINSDRDFIGIEIDPKFYAMAVERIREAEYVKSWSIKDITQYERQEVEVWF